MLFSRDLFSGVSGGLYVIGSHSEELYLGLKHSANPVTGSVGVTDIALSCPSPMRPLLQDFTKYW